MVASRSTYLRSESFLCRARKHCCLPRLLAHTPTHGAPTLVSLPCRVPDSSVCTPSPPVAARSVLGVDRPRWRADGHGGRYGRYCRRAGGGECLGEGWCRAWPHAPRPTYCSPSAVQLSSPPEVSAPQAPLIEASESAAPPAPQLNLLWCNAWGTKVRPVAWASGWGQVPDRCRCTGSRLTVLTLAAPRATALIDPRSP